MRAAAGTRLAAAAAAAGGADGVSARHAAPAARDDPLARQLARAVAQRGQAEHAPPPPSPARRALAREGTGDPPHAKRKVSGWARWGIGALQLLGGGLELVGGGAAMLVPEPTMLSKVGGVILIGHGTDTFTSGIGTLWSGEVSETYTARGAEAGAGALGASPETAHWIGVGVDVAAGVGSSVAVGVARRVVIVGSEKAGATMTLGYLHKGAAQMGHNIVGIAPAGGGEAVQFYHLLGVPGGRVAFIPFKSTSADLVAEGYTLTRIPIAAAGAQQSVAAAASKLSLQLPRAGMRAQGSNPMWSYVGPNCTTVATRLLEAGGVAVPGYAQTPLLLHLGVSYGWAPLNVVTTGAVGATAGVGSSPPAK